jgi:hypothetical protein
MVERAVLRRSFLALVALAPLSISFVPGQAQVTGQLLTRAERTDFRETSRYDEVVQFVSEVVKGRPDMHLATLGYTFEGRPIPLVVVGRVADGSPESVRATEKTRVYLQGGIHAGEIAGKEALLILLRELAQGQHSHWADSLVLLVAPLYNADGNERINVLNRPRQHGPVGGMGQRANAQGLDLNRDHLKLDAPESRSLAKLFADYDPHVAVDLHTTNGTRHGYHLTYAPPLHPATPQAIDALLRDRLLPAITRAVKEKHGWDMYHFGDVRPARGGMEPGWYTFDHRARFSNNYAGLRNRLGILGEAFAYATFEERTRVSLWFVEEIVHFSHAHATEMARTAAAADRLPLIGEPLAVRAGFRRSVEPVTILMGEVEEELNPYSGRMMLRRTGVQIPQEMDEFVSFQATETEIVPPVYYLPPDLVDLRMRLGAHGAETLVLAEARTVEVEEFVVDSLATSTREYQGRFEQEVLGSYRSATRTLEPGTVAVPMDQPLARVIFALLEPRSDDGFVAWGFLSGSLRAGEPYPILRGSPGTSPRLSLHRPLPGS